MLSPVNVIACVFLQFHWYQAYQRKNNNLNGNLSSKYHFHHSFQPFPRLYKKRSHALTCSFSIVLNIAHWHPRQMQAADRNRRELQAENLPQRPPRCSLRSVFPNFFDKCYRHGWGKARLTDKNCGLRICYGDHSDAVSVVFSLPCFTK